jgi:hypothetical protein
MTIVSPIGTPPAATVMSEVPPPVVFVTNPTSFT